MKSKKPEAKITTIAIYKKDWKKLLEKVNKNETFRDKIHQLIKKERKKQNAKKN